MTDPKLSEEERQSLRDCIQQSVEQQATGKVIKTLGFEDLFAVVQSIAEKRYKAGYEEGGNYVLKLVKEIAHKHLGASKAFFAMAGRNALPEVPMESLLEEINKLSNQEESKS